MDLHLGPPDSRLVGPAHPMSFDWPRPPDNGYDFSRSMNSLMAHSRFSFGPRDSHSLTVDQTLATLFDTLTVECSGVLVQPQWKHFRHIQMLKNDQIRLSNGIWRSWHLQFQKVKTPLYCTFLIEPKLDHHKRQEAVVLEGKYWKRKESAVATEYRKWRHHYHKKSKTRKHDPYLDEVREKAAVIFEELQGRPRPAQNMQIDPPKPSFLQNYNDFPDPLLSLMDTSSAVYSSTDIGLQQPNLDMLNPTLDDFLNKFEPMDVVLPRTLTGALPSMYSTPPQPHTFTNSTPSQMQKSVSFSQPLTTPTFESPAYTSPPNETTPPQHVPFTPPTQVDPYVHTRLTEGTNQPYSVSPSSFLNMPSGNDGGRGNMDIGQFPIKPEPILDDQSRSTNQNSCLYPLPSYHQGNPQDYSSMNRTTVAEDIFSMQSSLQSKVDDMEGAYGGSFGHSDAPSTQLHPSQHTPTRPHTVPVQPRGNDVFQFSESNLLSQSNQYVTPLSTGHVTNTVDIFPPSQPFVRVSSAGNLGTVSSLPSVRPPLQRGKSEPIRRLREQVQKLSAQNEKQLMEIDKQKNFAEKQYTELLQTVVHQQVASGKTSEQQQQVLQSVLADPSLVGILRDVLLTTPTPGGGGSLIGGEGPVARGDVSTEKMSLSELHMKSASGHVTSPPPKAAMSPPNIVSPTDLAKVTGVSDFQSRLLVAAASQAAQSSSFTAPPPIGSTVQPPVMSPYSSYLSGGSDSETTPNASAVAQLRFKPPRKLNSEEKEVYRELRRQSHISAEQKRRGSIKHGFDHLQSLVVNLSAYPSGKVSKAVILEKTIEHIHHCHVARDERERKSLALKKEIEDLNTAIAHCQEMLPASGVPVTRQRFEENRQRFREYVQRRTHQNYKFWIFSIILKQLFESYNSMVSTGSVDELCRTVLAWFEQNCALPALRPVVMTSLRELSQKTSILTDPSQVPRQLAQYAQQEMQQHRQEQEKARTTRLSFS